MKLIAVLHSKKRPLLLGFAISLLGALPLGYTNVISLQILLEQGNRASLSFILGIIFVQYFVLKTVYKIASWLIKQKKLLLFIELFTILFLLVIGIYFMYSSTKHQKIILSNLILIQYPFLLAVFLNLLNFIQWPYWSGIYIYLFRTDKLDNQIKTRNKFIVGALLGTSLGMFLFAHVGQFLLIKNQIKISSYINTIFMILFLFLAFIQTIKFIFKNTYDRKEINEL
jgi:threonine/homoserine/homoserine lactone efflux protein